MKLSAISYIDCKSVEKTIEKFKQSTNYATAPDEYKQGVEDLVNQLFTLMTKEQLKLLSRRC